MFETKERERDRNENVTCLPTDSIRKLLYCKQRQKIWCRFALRVVEN